MKFRNSVACSAIIGAALILAACGSESATTTTDTVDQTAASSQPSEADVAPASETAPAALPTTSLDRDALFGLVSETVIETAQCPFLSDTTAIATAQTDYDLVRREVSNEECRWSMNAGFSVSVSVASAATATPLRDRPYNLETPPVVKEQSGPGNDAVILYDTAWETERPYAMGFEQDGKLVTIFVTGLETGPARLTATAEEVAEKLPTAPTIEKQYREIVPALEYCEIWPDESIAWLAQATQEEGLYSALYGTAGCKWSGGYGANAKAVTLGRYKQGDTNLERMLELGGETISGLGDQAVILTQAPSDGYAGDTSIWVDIESHQFNVTVTGTISNHAEIAETLARNLFSRI